MELPEIEQYGVWIQVNRRPGKSKTSDESYRIATIDCGKKWELRINRSDVDKDKIPPDLLTAINEMWEMIKGQLANVLPVNVYQPSAIFWELVGTAVNDGGLEIIYFDYDYDEISALGISVGSGLYSRVIRWSNWPTPTLDDVWRDNRDRIEKYMNEHRGGTGM